MTVSLDFHYTQEHLTNQATRLGQIFGIENAGGKIGRDGFHIETLGPEIATITITMQRHVSVEEARRLLQAVPIDEEPFLTGSRVRVSADATTGEMRSAIVHGAIHPEDFSAWLNKSEATLVAATRARQVAEIRLLIHDLDNARADGNVLTYGYIQHRLNQMLGTLTPEPETDRARRSEEQGDGDAS